VPTSWADAVKARDGYRCVICGSAEGVAAHHIRPRSEGGPHTLANGETRCRRHHQEAHVA
jgi:5-methylcytosine-specific restriction endonuclease McrA